MDHHGARLSMKTSHPPYPLRNMHWRLPRGRAEHRTTHALLFAALLLLATSAWLILIDMPRLRQQALSSERALQAINADQAARAASQIVDINQRVINTLPLADISNQMMERLVNHGAASGVRVSDVRVSEVNAPQPTVNDDKVSRQPPFRATSLRAKLSGPYAKVKSVLAEMQWAFPGLALEAVNMQKGPTAGNVEAEMTWLAYRRNGG
jgi:hypothetical protein